MKKEENMKKQGWAIHLHHGKLVEYCYDYDKRVEFIKEYKPTSERETRLRLFKLLPDEAVKDIPVRYRKATAEWEKVYAEWAEECAEWQKAYAEWEKADAGWTPADRAAFHKKWCGCKEWDGEEIFFKTGAGE